MTIRANYRDSENFGAEDGAEDEVELSMVKQLVSAVGQIATQLRRTVVFVPIFGVAFLAIGFLWTQSVQAESSMKAESASLRILLDQPAPQPALLLQQAAGWDTAYLVVLDRRIARPADSDLIGHVIDAAESAGLVVMETGTTDDGEVTLENEKYTVTPLLLKANGTFDGIEDFLAVLETPEFASFEIQAATLNSEAVGYLLTLKGVFYSLPETFGDALLDDSGELISVPVVPVDAVDNAGLSEVAP